MEMEGIIYSELVESRSRDKKKNQKNALGQRIKWTSDEIGRHKRLKISRSLKGMWVQVPPRPPICRHSLKW